MDEAFTVECVNKFATDKGLSTAPAIACLKQLKVLKIESCNKLTDFCVSNGITKCNTLKRVEIRSC